MTKQIVITDSEGKFWQVCGKGGSFVIEYPDASKFTSRRDAETACKMAVRLSGDSADVVMNYGNENELRVTFIPEAF